MRELVRTLARDGARVLLANTFFMAPYHAYAPRTRLVVDTHNIDSANLARYVPQLGGAKRAYASLTVPKMRVSEAHWSARADDVWVCSTEDAALLAQIAPQRAPYRVVPNGVDAERFAPWPTPRTPGRFVFFGRLDYFPNRDAVEYLAREIMPRVPTDVPLEIRIVGAGDLAPIRALAALDARITVVGRVPDVRDEVGSAVASLVPLRAGGGTRLKLLESLSLATPAISTTVGAEGLLPELADGMWLTDTAEAFAAQLTALARDAAPAVARGVAGRAAVEARYHWPALEAVMQARLEALLAA
jgi:glycosyltransferase involved in cell wall biosynthesis